MRNLIVIVLVLLFAVSTASAERWCQWSGTQGENCLNDKDGILRPPGYFAVKIIGNEAKINGYGYYFLTTTQPIIGADQYRDAEVWALVGNQMSLTWTVADYTAQEILEREARAMSLLDYLQWKAIVQFTSATSEQVEGFLTANYPDIVAAFLARKELQGD